jgi:pimeloyl-ACP methyl ester carboxylesterase
MRPAFSSPKSAAAFAILLLVLLLSPALAGKWLLPPRNEIYTSTPLRYAPSHYLYEQIYKEKQDIDIAFIGSSRIRYDIDTPYVQRKLSEKLGRKAVVVTLGWSWSGCDALYFVTRDLLQNRKVHLIVSTEELYQENDPHRAATYWFRYGDDAEVLEGLPLSLQTAYYYGAMLEIPHNLLALIRSNIPKLQPTAAAAFDHGDPTNKLGAAFVPFDFDENPNARSVFVPYTPSTSANPADVCIYSKATSPVFHFGHSAAPLQLHFAREFGRLVEKHHIPLAYLHIPDLNEARVPMIQEREYWPDVIETNLTMFGISPATMFSSLSDSDVRKLFFNPLHLNENGQKYFTRLITPRLLQIYASQAKH